MHRYTTIGQLIMYVEGTGILWFDFDGKHGWNEPSLGVVSMAGQLALEYLDLARMFLRKETIPWGENSQATKIWLQTARLQPAQPKVSVAKVTARPGDRVNTASPDQVVVEAYRDVDNGCVHVLISNNLNFPLQIEAAFMNNTPGVYTPEIWNVQGFYPLEKSDPNPWNVRNATITHGRFVEWLEPWGRSVIRLNGTGSCAVPPRYSHLQTSDLLYNPSFELNLINIGQADDWCVECCALH